MMLEINHLQVNYGDSIILKDVSLTLPKGRVVCLMGRNGVGKTTLIKTIMGTIKPRNGTIKLGVQELQSFSPHKRAQAGIAYVPQGRGIFPQLTVYENLLMGFEATPRAQTDSARVAEMYQLFPILETMRNRVAGTLSGGQQQQLAIARALASRPKLLLLDEPTEGIQPSIIAKIEELIISLREKREMTILVVEQFLDFARAVADQFYIMETGNIVEHGEIADFSDEIAKTYLAV